MDVNETQLQWGCENSLLRVNHACYVLGACMVLILLPAGNLWLIALLLPFLALERLADGWGFVIVLGSPGAEFGLSRPVGACIPGMGTLQKVPACYCFLSLHQIE